MDEKPIFSFNFKAKGLILQNDKGEKELLEPTCFVVFIDETGHEKFLDQNYPVFGIGGCAVFANDYEEVVKKPWEKMKDGNFGGSKISLHASELKSPTTDQLKALEKFFKEQTFYRLVAISTKNATFTKEFSPFQAISYTLLNRIKEVVEGYSFITSIALVIEKSERLDKIFFDSFSRVNASIVNGNLTRKIPIKGFFLPKKAHEAGSEVADFIMQASGARVNAKLNTGKLVERKDYNAIFKNVDKKYVSFFEINDVTFNTSKKIIYKNWFILKVLHIIQFLKACRMHIFKFFLIYF